MTHSRRVDYVRYASYLFVEKHRDAVGESPTGVMYNKYMTLLNRALKDHMGKDIGLPHCWYRWGDEVVRINMPYLSWNHDDPRKTVVDYTGAPPPVPPRDDTVAYMKTFTEDFLDRYSGTEGVEMAIDEVYTGAPFGFQNDYRMLRDNLRLAQGNFAFSNHTDMVSGLFEQAMASFPSESFPDILAQRDVFEHVFRLALDRNLSVDRLRQISETFWFFFCYHLRLNDRCHENISEETMGVWRSVLPDALYEYECKMQNYGYYLSRLGCDDPIIRGLVSDQTERVDSIASLMTGLDGAEP